MKSAVQCIKPIFVPSIDALYIIDVIRAQPKPNIP
jgi:hypothetical protein